MAVIKHKNQRVGIFIDTQNLYHSAKNIYGAKVNYDLSFEGRFSWAVAYSGGGLCYYHRIGRRKKLF